MTVQLLNRQTRGVRFHVKLAMARRIGYIVLSVLEAFRRSHLLENRLYLSQDRNLCVYMFYCLS